MLFILLVQLSLAFGPGTDYNTFNLNPEADVYKFTNELYDREKCKTCCRIMFYNEKYDRVMDMEFNDKDKVRYSTKNYEQTILMRPLDNNRLLHFFELAPYKQINVYSIPKRVMDVRSGSVVGNSLIIWYRKPPLDPNTDNQRFTYVYPYGSDMEHSDIPKHLLVWNGLCLEVGEIYNTWAGNRNLAIDGKQITAQRCSSDKAGQKFEIIYG